jgi:hypothetical protein
MIFHSKPDRGPGSQKDNSSIDVGRLEDLISLNIEFLCRYFLPEGRKVKDQWCVASSPRIGRKKNRPGSLSINLEGKYAGCWRDWADNTHGTFTSLLMARRGLSFPDAARVIASCLGVTL